ncbi:NPCBM/NEW2 domain-containing protein [Clostridium sp. Cult2]|uniref:NPCBM/NEW2 domain-containing protein n=1 Tax=Clostridium sp. Cult2 TaxID=2079003 RepID=UPI001F3E495B|nr:NPCBM/NEW2 domain-containing protein [Clostridium sp. Cult2]MCF6464910.1 copper amine oxidase [Clostridium sp. Cult2]
MKAKERFKYLLIGMIIMTVFSTVAPVIAAMVQKQIIVSTGVNIYVDDVKLNPVDGNGKPVEVFIYNGTTYLPVRAVANAVGKPVLWDGKTSSVYLGKHDSNEPTAMLHELDYFDSSQKNGFAILKDVEDNLANSYNYGVTVVSPGWSINEGWQTYYVNGMYSKIKGKYALSYKNRNTTVESRLKIYGDDKLLYNSPVMTGGVKPIDFEVDLTGVLELKLEITNSKYDNTPLLVDVGLYQ